MCKKTTKKSELSVTLFSTADLALFVQNCIVLQEKKKGVQQFLLYSGTNCAVCGNVSCKNTVSYGLVCVIY